MQGVWASLPNSLLLCLPVPILPAENLLPRISPICSGASPEDLADDSLIYLAQRGCPLEALHSRMRADVVLMLSAVVPQPERQHQIVQISCGPWPVQVLGSGGHAAWAAD